MKTLTLVTAIALLSSWQACAHNNLFLPGDAFFSAELDREFFRTREVNIKGGPGAKEEMTFAYHRYAGDFMACGWAGYESLTVTGIPAQVRHNLRKAHGILFSEFARSASTKSDLGEGAEPKRPYFPIYIYNRDFPLSSPFGVKYNERWAEVQVEEAKMSHAIYDDLGGDGIDFVIDDWASARDIAPLKISDGRAPMVTPDGETGIVEKPVEVPAKEVMFVVLAGGDVAKFGRREEGLVFFVVTEELRRYRFDRKGVAMPQVVDAPADEIAAKRATISKDQRSLRSALHVYKMNFGKLPNKAQGLKTLVKKPKTNTPKK